MGKEGEPWSGSEITRPSMPRWDPPGDPSQWEGDETIHIDLGQRGGDGSSAWERFLDQLRSRGPGYTRYAPLGELARGGMGAVHRVFDHDARRVLAMKVMLANEERSDNRPEDELVGRFLEEAQVASQLDHPGIVPVHEIGLDREGKLYFTMKLVKGEALREVIDRVHDAGDPEWTLTRAVGVLLRVCEAMSYAHAKGVLHRDLKPSNVMVGRFGETYVMDWGLARVVDHDDTRDIRPRDKGPASVTRIRVDRLEVDESDSDDALRTMDGDVIGTPAYMPPEQARGDLEAIGPAADVYAVGAMLYHLLAGCMPYSREGSRLSSRVILGLVILGPPPSLAKQAPGVPEELTSICERAMARRIEDRYGSMDALASDLQAYLENRVVAAHEAGAWAEARKWMRRNRTLASTVAVAAALVVLVTSVSFRQVIAKRREAEFQRSLALDNEGLAREQERLAQDSAEEARRMAQRAADEATAANELVSFLGVDLFASIDPLRAQGREVTVREVLDRAAQRVERFADRPAIEQRLRHIFGSAYADIGHLEQARPHLERALELRVELYGERSLPVADTLEELAHLASDRGLLEEAVQLGERALVIREAELGELHESTLSLRGNLAMFRAALTGRGVPGLEGGTLQMLAGLLQKDAETVREELDAASLEVERLWASGDREACVAIIRELHEPILDFPWIGEQSPWSMASFAQVLLERGYPNAAEALGYAAVELGTESFGEKHVFVIKALRKRGDVLRRLRKLDEAEVVLREAKARIDEVLGIEHAYAVLVRWDLGNLESARGSSSRAAAWYLEALETSGDREPETLDDFHLRKLAAEQLMAEERWEEARATLEPSLGLDLERLEPEAALIGWNRQAMGEIHLALGHPGSAEAVLLELAELSDNPTWVGAAAERLVLVYGAMGNEVLAARWRERAAEALESRGAR